MNNIINMRGKNKDQLSYHDIISIYCSDICMLYIF